MHNSVSNKSSPLIRSDQWFLHRRLRSIPMGSDSASIASGHANQKKHRIPLDGGQEILQTKRGDKKHDNELVLLTSRSVDNGSNRGVSREDGVKSGVSREDGVKRINNYRRDCFSRSNVDEEKGGEVLDNWEVVADALNIKDLVPPSQDMKGSSRSNSCTLDYGVLLSDLKANNASRGRLHQTNNSAWRPGDVF